MSGVEHEDSGFLINGERYEVPTLESFDMDESDIL